MRTLIRVVFSSGATICGIVAAVYWFRASRLPTRPSVLDQVPMPGLEDATLSENNWAWEFLQTAAEAATLNAKAALWTAAAVMLGGAASLCLLWT